MLWWPVCFYRFLQKYRLLFDRAEIIFSIFHNSGITLYNVILLSQFPGRGYHKQELHFMRFLSTHYSYCRLKMRKHHLLIYSDLQKSSP